MSDVTLLLDALRNGNGAAADQLLPIVYAELRRLALARMAQERGEHTLQPTALVHEAYLRLVGAGPVRWDGRGHFFAAAAEAMRRILIEHARHKNALKNGGKRKRIDLTDASHPMSNPFEDRDDLLALDEALTRFEAEHPERAQLVKLLYFAGLNLDQAAEAMKTSRTTACRHWAFARAWLHDALKAD